MPRLLDLFCGAGGASYGYYLAGWDVVGVDVKYQRHYLFEFHRADALTFLEEEGQNFDAIHASPPCQAYSTLRAQHPEREYVDLVAATRLRLQAAGVPYVIENVPHAPLLDPVQLCGSSFALPLRRHRLFESNVAITGLPCRHHLLPAHFRVWRHGRYYRSRFVPVYGHGGTKRLADWQLAMQIDWMSMREMAQAIPPAYTRHVGRQLLSLT